MKKPKIRFIPYEGFAVKKSSGEYLDDDVTAEAYKEMIDALINTVESPVMDDGMTMLDDATRVQIKKALKKSGVE